jgi:hypothetical protein
MVSVLYVLHLFNIDRVYNKLKRTPQKECTNLVDELLFQPQRQSSPVTSPPRDYTTYN